MKPRYILISVLFLSITSLMVFDAAFNEANSHTSGAAAMRTGSPGDAGATSKNCHAGPTPTTQAGLITSTIPLAGYTAGQTYTIDLESATMDSYLYLFDSKTALLAQDDDSGGDLNSRITFRADADGVYHIIATTLGGDETGDFTLKVRKGE